jgi:hypothetical protein
VFIYPSPFHASCLFLPCLRSCFKFFIQVLSIRLFSYFILIKFPVASALSSSSVLSFAVHAFCTVSLLMYFFSLSMFPLFPFCFAASVFLCYCNSEIERNTTNMQEMHRLIPRVVSSVIASHLASGQWLSTFRSTLQWMLGLVLELWKETSVRGWPFRGTCGSVPVSVSCSCDILWRFVKAVV